MSSEVMHHRDHAEWGKTSPDLDMQVEIYGMQTRKVTCGYI